MVTRYDGPLSILKLEELCHPTAPAGCENAEKSQQARPPPSRGRRAQQSIHHRNRFMELKQLTRPAIITSLYFNPYKYPALLLCSRKPQ
jgi:hypothetical protein